MASGTRASRVAAGAKGINSGSSVVVIDQEGGRAAPGHSGGVPGAECGGRDVVAGGGGGGHAVAEGAGGVDDEHAADPARPHRRLRCG